MMHGEVPPLQTHARRPVSKDEKRVHGFLSSTFGFGPIRI